MDTPPAEEAPPTRPVLLECTVLVTGTKIGKLRTGKGHKCRLPKDKAEALESLKQPRVRIEGV